MLCSSFSILDWTLDLNTCDCNNLGWIAHARRSFRGFRDQSAIHEQVKLIIVIPCHVFAGCIITVSYKKTLEWHVECESGVSIMRLRHFQYSNKSIEAVALKSNLKLTVRESQCICNIKYHVYAPRIKCVPNLEIGNHYSGSILGCCCDMFLVNFF